MSHTTKHHRTPPERVENIEAAPGGFIKVERYPWGVVYGVARTKSARLWMGAFDTKAKARRALADLQA